MNTNEFVKSDTIKQKIQLVKGEFSPLEGSDLVLSLIDEKINFHRKQRFQKWEQNHENSLDELDNRIKQLEKEKLAVIEFIANAKNLNSNLIINSILEITAVEN